MEPPQPPMANIPDSHIPPPNHASHRRHPHASPSKGDYTSWSGPMDKTDIAMLGSSVIRSLRSHPAAAVADG